jgi:histidinol-phosphate aminotransferase
MTHDIYQLANKGVQSLQAYAPGKPMSELERELGLSEIIKLASNENPLGCSKKVKSVLSGLDEELTLYPDGNGFALKDALVNHLLKDKSDISQENIILGNGSNDVLELIARAFLNEESEAVYSEYAFAVYPIAVQAVSAQAKIAPAKNWGHDLDAMLSLVSEKTKVVFIANPNNPTGSWLTKEEIESFLSSVPEHTIVVLDEAYFEYVEEQNYPNGLNLLDAYKNLIVTRTFSKAYGIAGLRVGYGVAGKEIIDILNRVRQPFNVNAVAQLCAVEALRDQEFISASVECNREGLQYLSNAFAELKLTYIESVANFISVDFGSPKQADEINQYLLKNGIIVRPITVYKMPSFLRVTVGSREQNKLLVDLLKSFFKNQPESN